MAKPAVNPYHISLAWRDRGSDTDPAYEVAVAVTHPLPSPSLDRLSRIFGRNGFTVAPDQKTWIAGDASAEMPAKFVADLKGAGWEVTSLGCLPAVLKEEALEEKIRAAFAQAQKSRDPFAGLPDCIDEFGVEATKRMMERVDPNRTVWDHPVHAGETGLHGLPMSENQYRFCSDIYGHDFFGYDADETFLEACGRGYDDGSLHGCGHLVIDKRTGEPAFLITSRLDDGVVPQNDDLAELAQRHEVTVECLAWPDRPGPYADSAHAAITARIISANRFKDVFEIASDMQDLVCRWSDAPTP